MPAVTETSLVIALSPAPTADAGIPHPEEQDDMTINEPRTPESMPSSAQSSTRRALVRGAAWVVPTALFATAAPAIAASDCVSSTVDANRPSTGRTDASSVSTVFTVPAGVFEIDVDIVGGAGGNSTAATQFSGLRTRGTLPVTPGQQLTLQVGQGGYRESGSPQNGWAGGGGYGDGGSTSYTPELGSGQNTESSLGGSGGGGSAILLGGTPLAVAGGGCGQGGLQSREPQGAPSWSYETPSGTFILARQGNTQRRVWSSFGADAEGGNRGAGGRLNGSVADTGTNDPIASQVESSGLPGGAGPQGNGGNGVYSWAGYGDTADRIHAVSAAGGGGYSGGGSGGLSRARWNGTNPTTLLAGGRGGRGGSFAADAVTGVVFGVGSNSSADGFRGPGSIVLTFCQPV